MFDDEEITHVDGEVNPVRDIETILDELRLKDIQYVEGRLDGLTRQVSSAQVLRIDVFLVR